VAVGDFNGDGKPDLAVANDFDNNVTIRLGDGTGGFPDAKSATVGAGARPISVAVGDFNGDGKLDLAIANNTDNNVTVQLNTCTANQPPVAKAGPDQTVECAGATTPVTLDGSASSDPDGDTLTYTWSENGSQIATGVKPMVKLAFGVHAITLTVTDKANLSDTAKVMITVADTTPPTISCPAPIVVDGSNLLGGARVNFSVTASDTCGGSPSLTYSKASGSLFPFGVTTVTVTANDGHGNSSHCSFTVTVRSPQQQAAALIAQVQALVTSRALTQSQGAGLTDKLNEVITKLNNGQTGPACLELNAFINQVNGFINGGTLSANGQSLITAANNIKTKIGC
jgi:hypothetical protein